eukprot:IDg17388t1
MAEAVPAANAAPLRTAESRRLHHDAESRRQFFSSRKDCKRNAVAFADTSETGGLEPEEQNS